MLNSFIKLIFIIVIFYILLKFMKLRYIVLILSFLNAPLLSAQNFPVFFDGEFNDWKPGAQTFTDAINDGAGIDFNFFQVTNDSDFLYFRLKINQPINLQEENSIAIYIDADNDSLTGKKINGIGADMMYGFGARKGEFYHNGNTVYFKFAAIKLRSLPTFTSDQFEIAVGRNVFPDGVNKLFKSSEIKVLFADNSANGDRMPDSGTIFSYIFDDTPVPPYKIVDLNKSSDSYLRIMGYNVLQDGLFESGRTSSFERIFKAVQPDIMCFNEFYDSTPDAVKNKISEILPLSNGMEWHAVKTAYDNITVSRYPILQTWLVDTKYGNVSASLIDLSSSHTKNILVINAHFRCCSANDKRQVQADEVISFIIDAKTPGGEIDLPEGTPFIISGDLNLAGYRQQLTTLLTGEIINTALYGSGGAPDWDGTGLSDLISYQSDKNMAYTWRNDYSTYPPARFDFMIYSNSAMKPVKTFLLETESMSEERLSAYGLRKSDSPAASDHLPKVADFTFDTTYVSVNDVTQNFTFNLFPNYPNPFNPSTVISYNLKTGSRVTLKLFDVLGNEIATLINSFKPAGFHKYTFDVSSLNKNLAGGVYFYRLETAGIANSKTNTSIRKMIYLK